MTCATQSSGRTCVFDDNCPLPLVASIPALLSGNGPILWYQWSATPGWPIDFISSNVQNLFGYLKHELERAHKPFAELVHPEDLPRISQECAQYLRDGHISFGRTYRVRCADNTYRWVSDSVTAVLDSVGTPRQYVGHLIDISGEERLRRLLTNDAMTGLSNLNGAKTRLNDAQIDGRPFWIATIDLDNFKAINDRYGDESGDEALRVIAERLRYVASGSYLCARIASDEFLVASHATREVVGELANNICRCIATPIQLSGGRELTITASVGIAGFGHDSATWEETLRLSRIATRHAHESGNGQSAFLNREYQAGEEYREFIEEELEDALLNNHLLLYYQPQINIRSGEISGVEALIRWNNPRRGFIRPDDFLYIAENTRLIGQIGEWVLNDACRQLSGWPSTIAVSINISARQLQDVRLPNKIAEALQTHGVSPLRLKLEITESSAANTSTESLERLQQIRDTGVGIEIDDFGKGFSSLSLLRKLPISTLKIDKEFVSNMIKSPEDELVIRTIAELGHGLGFTVIAEGVETEEQLLHLRNMNVDLVQGFLFSPAVLPGEILPMARRFGSAPPVFSELKRRA